MELLKLKSWDVQNTWTKRRLSGKGKTEMKNSEHNFKKFVTKKDTWEENKQGAEMK